jgi:hypothetical protein
MKYGSDGNTHIETARATSEERKRYAERNKEGGREKTGALAQHSGYSGEMESRFAQINAITDCTHKPTYEDTDELTQVLQGLHMSQILGIDDDGADEDGPNDIDISRMNGSARNDDYTIGGSPALQDNLHALIKEFDDIFSYSVKGRSMDVPPMEIDVDKKLWEASSFGVAID